MPNITDTLRARGIGAGGGINPVDLQALIDVSNTAEANNDAIKTDVINKLKALNPELNLSNTSSWSTIRAAIDGMLYKGAVTITPGPSDIVIPAGYHSGSGKVSGVTVPAQNVLTGTTIAGTAGTMANKGAVTLIPGASAVPIPQGYHNGAGMVQGDSNLIPSNILSGKSIFGVAGTAPGAGYFYDFGENNGTFAKTTTTFQWDLIKGIKKGGHALLMGTVSYGIRAEVVADGGKVYPGDSARLKISLYDEVTGDMVTGIINESYSYGSPGNTTYSFDWIEVDHAGGRVRIKQSTFSTPGGWLNFSPSTSNSIRLAAEFSVVNTSTAGANGYLRSALYLTAVALRT